MATIKVFRVAQRAGADGTTPRYHHESDFSQKSNISHKNCSSGRNVPRGDIGTVPFSPAWAFPWWMYRSQMSLDDGLAI
jgi:hypothetical protein